MNGNVLPVTVNPPHVCAVELDYDGESLSHFLEVSVYALTNENNN